MKNLACCLLGGLLLFSVNLGAQLPQFETRVLDVNTTPQPTPYFEVPSYLPAADSSFFFSFHGYPKPLLHYTGNTLDTVLKDGTINAQVYGRYAGGYLLYQNDGTLSSSRTYHLDTVTYRTTLLARNLLGVRYVFPDGRRLLEVQGNGSRYLYAIGDGPGSLTELGSSIDMYSTSFVGLGARFVYESPTGTFVTDGTRTGTRLLTKALPRPDDGFAAIGGKAYFATEQDLYVTDGTVAGTTALTFDHLPEEVRPHYVALPFATANGPVFYGRTEAGGGFYYYLDTESGSFLPLVGSDDQEPARNDSIAVFRQRKDLGRSVMVTDGSPAGTRELIAVAAEDEERETWSVGSLGALDNGSLYFTTGYTTDVLYWYARPGEEPVSFQDPDVLTQTTEKFWITQNQWFVIRGRGPDQGVYRHDPATGSFEQLTDLEPVFERMELHDGGILIHLREDEYNGKESTLIYYHGEAKMVDGHIGALVQGKLPASGNLALRQVGDELFGIGVEATTGESIVAFDLPTGVQRVLQDLSPRTLSANPRDLVGGDRAVFFENDGMLYGSGRGGEFELLFDQADIKVTPVPGRGFSLLKFPSGNGWYFSDGTRRGTVALGTSDYRARSGVAVLEGDAYFLGESAAAGRGLRLALVRISGETGAFTEVYAVSTNFSSLPYERKLSIASSGSRIYFTLLANGAGWSVLSSDGTTRGTSLAANTFGEHPFELTGGDGFVQYYTRKAENPISARRYFLLRDGEISYEYYPEGVLSQGAPVRVPGLTIYPGKDSILGLADGSVRPRKLMSCSDCYPSQLTVVDAATVLYTAATDGYLRSVFRLNLTTGESTLLVDNIPSTSVRTAPLAVLGDLLLTARQRWGTSIIFDELLLVDIPRGDWVEVTDPGGIHHIGDIVMAGNRFAFIDEDEDTYGEEVFTITFPNLPEIKSGTVAVREVARGSVPVTIFPNPTSSSVTLQVPSAGRYRYRLFSIGGELIRTGELRSTLHPLKLDGFRSGTYVLEIWEEATGVRTSRRIVVSN